MLKKLIVPVVFVCLIATTALAQSTAPSAPPSNSPQTTPAPAAPATPAKGAKHARKGPALHDIDDPRVKDLLAKHHAEKMACRKNSSVPGCADLAARQKEENRTLRTQLKKEGKL